MIIIDAFYFLWIKMNSSMRLNGVVSSACNLTIKLNIEKVKDILFVRNIFFNLIKDKSVSGS
jgi:hypothetical protein